MAPRDLRGLRRAYARRRYRAAMAQADRDFRAGIYPRPYAAREAAYEAAEVDLLAALQEIDQEEDAEESD